jgi:D-psicose/D-tagatose/L-ribulose 3-epimerase
LRYGFCKEFSTPLRDRIDYDLVTKIKEAGFDYIELRLMLVAFLSEKDFEVLIKYLKDIDLPCDVCCALFPKTVRVTGKDANSEVIRNYLESAFSRASILGAKKLVFGSAPARALDEFTTEEQGYMQLADMLQNIMIPLCEKYDITVVIEPLRRDACNFINTLTDGMKLVRMVNSNRIQLLADSLHMLTNEEPADQILDYRDYIKHVHIADKARALPEDGYSSAVASILKNLKLIGYDNTISFESKNGNGLESMRKALSLLKKQF